MKFLCLGYFDAAKMDALPKGALDAIMAECERHLDELYATGQVIIDAGLDLQAAILQRADGTVKEGRGSRSGEVIGSALLIEATDMDDAVRIASLHPTTRIAAAEQLGWRMEIRPIHYFKAS